MIKQVMSEIDDYFQYLSEIVGIKSILIDPNDSRLEKINLLIKVQNLSNYDAAATELLEKMIAALGLDRTIIKVSDYDFSPNKVLPEYTLSFVTNPDQFAAKDDNEVVTFSPEVLLKKPQLKKQAWEQMQKVVAQIKSTK